MSWFASAATIAVVRPASRVSITKVIKAIVTNAGNYRRMIAASWSQRKTVVDKDPQSR